MDKGKIQELSILFQLLKDNEWLINQLTYESRYSGVALEEITMPKGAIMNKMTLLKTLSKKIQDEITEKIKDTLK